MPVHTALLRIVVPLALVACAHRTAERRDLSLARRSSARPPNILLVLVDDHRHDALGFLGHPLLQTPHLDRLARDGVHFRNAFVTTSLCSPSRASILTGLYAHSHGVVDNYTAVDRDLVFFPQYLQAAGYETALVGKWHMGGDEDRPQRGFDHWLSFKGQGSYWADGRGTTRVVPQTSADGYNLNGRRVPQKGYITDELTDHALSWLSTRRRDRPFFLYLSHKAAHSDFVPADRHRGRYRDRSVPPPATLAPPIDDANAPMWVRNQRNSRHGVDFGYNLERFDLQEYARRYFETLLAVDDSMGRLLAHLERTGELSSTLILFMGDNGFQLGEHGLIDKRTAYEESMRVPLLVHWPAGLRGGATVTEMVANIDVAPTLLDAAGLEPPRHMHGRSFLPLARGQRVTWRDELLYEYYWEWNYPHTPTIHALRTPRWKYVRAHGVWDLDELYDLRADPQETRNLIGAPAHADTVRTLKQRLFALLAATGGEQMPLRQEHGERYPLRHPGRAPQAPFPSTFVAPRAP